MYFYLKLNVSTFLFKTEVFLVTLEFAKLKGICQVRLKKCLKLKKRKAFLMECQNIADILSA